MWICIASTRDGGDSYADLLFCLFSVGRMDPDAPQAIEEEVESHAPESSSVRGMRDSIT